MLRGDIFLFLNSSTCVGLHQGGSRKRMKKCVYSPADLEAALPVFRVGIATKATGRM
jgi:hypothetical protein